MHTVCVCVLCIYIYIYLITFTYTYIIHVISIESPFETGSIAIPAQKPGDRKAAETLASRRVSVRSLQQDHRDVKQRDFQPRIFMDEWSKIVVISWGL